MRRKNKRRDALEMSFNIVGGRRNDAGELTGLVTDTGFTLTFADKDGNPLPLNEDNIRKATSKNTKED